MASGKLEKNVAIAPLLSEDRIIVGRSFADKNQLQDALVKLICKSKALGDSNALLKKIQEREHGVSTTLESGLSLPHVRLDDFHDVTAALAVLSKPVVDPEQPDFPIYAMLLFLSSNDTEHSQRHLQMLRNAAILFRVDFMKQLASSKSAASVLELIRRRESLS
ncbi:MAG: PTS sugar transporter subunit IIA [Elusimicrobia bacterium]|nr:PTS sugar transporter subunit IIA [Elusimicrobiota bacterium]